MIRLELASADTTVIVEFAALQQAETEKMDRDAANTDAVDTALSEKAEEYIARRIDLAPLAKIDRTSIENLVLAGAVPEAPETPEKTVLPEPPAAVIPQ